MSKRRAGWIRNTSAGNIWEHYSWPDRVTLEVARAGESTIMTGVASPGAWSPIAANAFAPPTAFALLIGRDNGAAGRTFAFRPRNMGTADVDRYTMFWSSASRHQASYEVLVDGAQYFDFVSSGNVSAYSGGYVDNRLP